MSEKFKINRNLATVLDAEGKEIKVQPREDVEQDIKLQEIIDLLVAAGYFRARIKGLSAFDKVVGGIVWCIDSCDVDIDVELLFQDDLTIGQKISLTEKIVAVLPKIKCPHRIEPHQIQGLDFIHIFPVVQWLVKRAMETREERSEYLKNYAANQFHRVFHFAEGESEKSIQKASVSNIRKIQEKHGPQRKYRRTGKLPADLMTRVESTLLEYGNVLTTQGGIESSSDNQQKHEVESRKEILKSFTSTTDTVSRVTPAIVGKIVSNKTSEFREAQLKTETPAERRIRQLKEKVSNLGMENNQLQKHLSEAEATLNSIAEKNEAFRKTESFTEEEKRRYDELSALLKKTEELKSQEIKFKEQCKAESAILQQQVSEAEAMVAELQDDSQGMKSQLEILEEKVNSARLELGKKTRAVSALERQLDQVPENAELAQYQLRFMELYSLVAAKHLETKQFYTRYNALNDTHRYLNRELSLLNSITDNFQVAMSNSSGRDEFLESVDNIVSNSFFPIFFLRAMSNSAAKDEFLEKLDKIVEEIQSNKLKVERRRNDEKLNRDELSAELSSLQDKQRQYVAALKQLSDEYKNS
ncbi:coiled-coil domain-containing protein 93 isoform X1 [Bemisia tabaci]|uniref:coiled-coil domain-containing protein 93 isoform X1 n=1 Tax=Bemisia tabaci TaxID=7038 RepID=UPI003B280892